ncbi:MAG: amidohydrolase family protein [Pseudolabrys sp.]
MVQKIALEEHFLSPGLIDYWRPTMSEVAAPVTEQLFAHLTAFGERRLEIMDKAGIARSVLSIAGPGVQAERDAALATRLAQESNDFLAAEIQKRPDRYAGFAHLALQDPQGAADELERCMRDLKFCGAMINGHTNGLYLDHASLHPFWERAEFGGLFDRFPKARLVLGHMGETLPYLLWRFDSRAKLYGVKLSAPPSHYIKQNIWVTVSGVFAAEPL